MIYILVVVRKGEEGVEVETMDGMGPLEPDWKESEYFLLTELEKRGRTGRQGGNDWTETESRLVRKKLESFPHSQPYPF